MTPRGRARQSKLATIVAALRERYGAPTPPPASNAFELVLWEMVAYLATDARRGDAFAALRKRVGLAPHDVLRANGDVLREVASIGGKVAVADRVAHMRDVAAIVIDEPGGSLDRASYATMYKSVSDAVRPELVDDFDWLIDAHLLLRRHGQETCKSSAPRCEICPVRARCVYGQRWQASTTA